MEIATVELSIWSCQNRACRCVSGGPAHRKIVMALGLSIATGEFRLARAGVRVIADPSKSGQEVSAAGVDDCFEQIPGAEFGREVFEVGLHGVQAGREVLGDDRVG